MGANWHELGINTNGRRSGQIKTICPQCSDQRKNKRDKCLSVDLGKLVFLCHHCGWAGKANQIGMTDMRQEYRPRKVYKKPDYKPSETPEESLLAWFQKRGISADVVKRNQIEARAAWMPDSGKEERAIAFPYLRNGEIINVQYRTTDKRFRLEKDAELILYGLDDVAEGEPLVFVEGQMDKLSLEQAGYPNCVSVPNGASVGDGEWLASAQPLIEKASAYILAGDNDEKGKALMAELERRLGPEKCWRAEWPEGCKDANDTLVKHGRERIIEAIETARPVPIGGIVEAIDLMPDLERLYVEGLKPGEHPGWKSLLPYYRPRAGEWTLLTGAPGTGKSEFLDALMVNLMLGSHWRFAVFSPEQEPLARHLAHLTELLSGTPFRQGPNSRMSWAGVKEAAGHIHDYFKFIQPEEEDLSVDGILKLAKACVLRYGINGLVIDPWNELEHSRPANVSETEFISSSLRRLRRFARMHGIHLWIMVHPTKLKKDENGEYPVATPYDCAGSAHWFNKADMILSLWRDKKDPEAPLQVHSQKVRFKENGDLGMAELWYDRITGRLRSDKHAEERPNWA